jgi:uncharacterized protein YdaU (DUF1376 family)
MKYYRRYPDAALAGMVMLTLEETGAYNIIIDMLYSRDGRLPDDDSMLCTALHCHGNKWHALKRRLIAKGKIWLADGFIKAKCVDAVIEKAASASKRQRERVAKRWAEPAGKASETSEKTSRNASEIVKNVNENNEPLLPYKLYNNTTSTNKGLTSFIGTPRREKRRLPRQPMKEDWRPTDNGFTYAHSLGFADARIEDEIRGCRNWHLKNGVLIAGETGLAATWRNWCDKALKIDNERRFHQKGAQYGRRMEKPELADRIREYADEARRYEHQAGIVRPPDAV